MGEESQRQNWVLPQVQPKRAANVNTSESLRKSWPKHLSPQETKTTLVLILGESKSCLASETPSQAALCLTWHGWPCPDIRPQLQPHLRARPRWLPSEQRAAPDLITHHGTRSFTLPSFHGGGTKRTETWSATSKAALPELSEPLVCGKHSKDGQVNE